MVERPRVLIPGGYGVFGRLLARELLKSGPYQLAIAGRRLRSARRACRALRAAERCEALALDLNDLEAVGRAAAGCFAVVCAAGPFQGLNPEVAKVAARAGAHWLDISDHEGWVLPLLADEDADRITRSTGTVIVPGLSTVPALSGILVRWARKRLPDAPRARITLFVGNRNPKGTGAIASALTSGFRDPVRVNLHFGTRLAYLFRSPDKALLLRELGIGAEFRVSFEWGLANVAMSWLQRPAARLSGERRLSLARWLSFLAVPFSRFGSDVGCLQVELTAQGGRGLASAFLGEGQRLAVLPAVVALEALLSGELLQRGCLSPASCLPPEEWITRFQTRGIQFTARRPSD